MTAIKAVTRERGAPSGQWEARMRELVVVLPLALAVSCGGSGGGGGVRPPAAPVAVTAVPGNGDAVVTWTPSPGATRYDVHYAATPGVTGADPKVTVAAPPATVPGLANGAVRWFAVSAVSDAGASALSAVACAVPTAADTAGLTLYDPLCAAELDGRRWQPPGANALRVANGAAVASVRMADLEPRAQRNASYASLAMVNGAGRRVTALGASVVVPAATAARAGGGQLRAVVRLVYSPPARRLNFPGANEDALVLEVGLLDSGAGLQAFRQVAHCDDARCAALAATGIAFVDPAGFASLGDGLARGAPAAYDVAYAVTVSLDEATGVLRWTVAGGAFGAGVSGSADPAAYLAATPAWSGVPLAGSGFQAAQMGVRALDASAGGGGAGAVAALFDDVSVGFDGGAAAPFDDFGGAGGSSGPDELSLAKWANGGAHDVGPSGGALSIRNQATAGGGVMGVGQGIAISDPGQLGTLQADVAIVSHAASGGATTNAFVQGRFYNDGSPGNAPYSALGDVMAGVFLSPESGKATYLVGRCPNATCTGALTGTLLGTFPVATAAPGVHTLRVRWNAAAHTFTLTADGDAVTVDPTAAVPFAKAANAPSMRVFTSVGVALPGASGSIEAKVSDVFVGP